MQPRLGTTPLGTEGKERRYLKAFLAGARQQDAGRKVFAFIASTDSVDRQGEIVTADGWELDAFRQNPVILNSHRYDSIENVLGTAQEIREIDEGLEVDISFNSTPLGRLAEQMVEDGSLRAVSVGFRPIEIEFPKGKEQPIKHTRKELLEVSLVAVPAQREALRVRGVQGEAEPPAEEPSTRTPVPAEPPDDAEGGILEPATQKAVPPPDDGDDPPREPRRDDAVLPIDGGLEAIWRFVSTAMVLLMTATDEVDERRRRRLYVGLERAYQVFGKEPPEYRPASELRALGFEDRRGLFWEGETEGLTAEPRVRTALANRHRDRLRPAPRLIRDVLAEVEQRQADEPRAIELDLTQLRAFIGRPDGGAGGNNGGHEDGNADGNTDGNADDNDGSSSESDDTTLIPVNIGALLRFAGSASNV